MTTQQPNEGHESRRPPAPTGAEAPTERIPREDAGPQMQQPTRRLGDLQRPGTGVASQGSWTPGAGTPGATGLPSSMGMPGATARPTASAYPGGMPEAPAPAGGYGSLGQGAFGQPPRPGTPPGASSSMPGPLAPGAAPGAAPSHPHQAPAGPPPSYGAPFGVPVPNRPLEASAAGVPASGGRRRPERRGRGAIAVLSILLPIGIVGGGIAGYALAHQVQSFDERKVEFEVAEVLRDDFGMSDLDTVNCPSWIKVEQGETFQCEFEYAGATQTVTVTQGAQSGQLVVGSPAK